MFRQSVNESHWLTQGIEREIVLPHSRWNAAPTDLVERAGYEIVVGSEKTGWGVAVSRTRQRGAVYFQCKDTPNTILGVCCVSIVATRDVTCTASEATNPVCLFVAPLIETGRVWRNSTGKSVRKSATLV